MGKKLTIEDMQAIAKKRRGKCLSSKYINIHSKLIWECEEGHQWMSTPSSIKHSKSWCPDCAGKKRLTIADFRRLARRLGGKCLSKTFVNRHKKLKWECSHKHRWWASSDKIKNAKTWCPKCSLDKKKSTIQAMQALARARGGKCLSKKYVDNRTKLLWECSEGHSWKAKPNSINSGRWCPKCSDTTLKIKEMQQLAKSRGGKCLSSKYINIHSKLMWECDQGHSWKAKPFHIKHSGSWCPVCAGKYLTIKDMRDLANLKGGKCLSEHYEGAHTELHWECLKGHSWEAKPNSIKNMGHWCPRCAGLGQTIQDMKEIARARAGNCLSKKYINAHEKLLWECGNNHRWSAKPSSIKSGTWCPECASGISERICKEYFQQVFEKPFPKRRPKWLINDRGNQMELDGYCKELRIAFEHQGSQHTTLDTHFITTEDELLLRKQDDKKKAQLCKQNSVRLIAIPQLFTDTKLDELLQFIYAECKTKRIRRPAGMLDKQIELTSAWMSKESKLVIKEMNLLAKLKGGKCLSAAYLNYSSDLEWECSEGHIWSAPASRIRKGHWCSHCAGNVKLTIEDMNEFATKRGGKCISKKYINIDTKLKWKCSEGHIWETIPYLIKKGSWCPRCKNRRKV